MELIDTHAHVYLPEFENDLAAIIDSAAQQQIKLIIMPAIDATTHEKMLQVEGQYASCVSMMGLHPCSVNQNFEKELQVVEDWLQKHKFYAVGEIGLDFYWDTTFKEQQFAAFHRQIELAEKFDLPIVIHSRNAIDECIEVVRQHPNCRGVFHCFSGNEEQAKKIIDLNFYLGIGGVVTFKNGGLDKVLPAVGIERLVLETDAPYLAPVPYRGKRNEPAYIKIVAEKIAMVLNMDVNEVAKITTANAKKLFSIA